jgi:hypothetical protein
LGGRRRLGGGGRGGRARRSGFANTAIAVRVNHSFRDSSRARPVDFFLT